VVPNGAPLRLAVNKAASASQKNPGNQISIAFMGRLGQRKGVYDLLEAFRRVSEELPNVQLLLGGDGEIEQVRKEVLRCGLEDRVQILGWVNGQDKFDVFDQADIYVLPSYNEGLPGSILEAMASSTPIISTPVGGIPEAVNEGVNGYLVDPGDVDSLYSRLLMLCKDSGLRLRMGEASRKLVEEKFDIKEIVNKVIIVYQDILSPQSRNPGSKAIAHEDI
jgi:glycosyltransferase involved in cell wall biosynthesis